MSTQDISVPKTIVSDIKKSLAGYTGKIDAQDVICMLDDILKSMGEYEGHVDSVIQENTPKFSYDPVLRKFVKL